MTSLGELGGIGSLQQGAASLFSAASIDEQLDRKLERWRFTDFAREGLTFPNDVMAGWARIRTCRLLWCFGLARVWGRPRSRGGVACRGEGRARW